MRPLRARSIVAIAVLCAGVGVGFYMSAQVSPPELAQAPMNLTNVVPPSFVMAVDDSGSMTYETLLPATNGDAFWSKSSAATNGFYDGNRLRTSGDAICAPYATCGTALNGMYYHVIPIGERVAFNRIAIPPLPLFGFARSPQINPSYFDPNIDYVPWLKADGTPYPQASLTRTQIDPRDVLYTIDLTTVHRDTSGDRDSTRNLANSILNYYDLPAGTYMEPTWDVRSSTNRSKTCRTSSGVLSIPASNSTAPAILGTAGRTLTAACAGLAIRTYQLDTPLLTPLRSEQFMVPEGATLPAGTRYYYDATSNGCGGIGTVGYDRQNWRTLQSPRTLTADCEMGIEYWTATFFLKDDAPAPAGFKAVDVPLGQVGGRSRVANACGSGCDLYRYEIRKDNYSTQQAFDAALQNFANWFTYYGNRNRAMIAAMTRSLSEVDNMRIGYFTINSHASNDDPTGDANERVAMHDMRDSTARTALFAKLLQLPASGGTPNRQAVNAVGQQFLRTDADAPIKLTCQKNAGMLFTDGYSNGDGPAVDNQDYGDGPMGAPFADANSDTMADIATRYYRFNLRPDLTPANALGDVPVSAACPADGSAAADPRLDCQRNLHMNFYGVTLGAKGQLFDPALAQDPYTDPAVYGHWPARRNDDPSTVDDIWHATTNTRGEFINARSPADVVDAMRRILSAVSEGASPAGTVAVTGARIGAGSLSLQPRYESANAGTDWYSTLRADQVSMGANGAASFTPVWEAGAKLSSQSVRNISFGRTGSSVVPQVLDFTAGNVGLADLCADTLSLCTAAQLKALAGGLTDAGAVAYLRGVRTWESGATPLRQRSSVLGDIINSTPVIAAAGDDYGYQRLGGTLAQSYATFLARKKAAARPLVLVGANDGMFHVFDGRTDGPGGEEVFAYIPATSIGHMGNLLFPYVQADGGDQKFQHRYFVDGPVAVSDVYVGGAWKTIAVATAGAGGRSVFALDITDPTAIKVLWEINNLVTRNGGVSGNIGHVLGKPVIVPVQDSRGGIAWKAIFGNGYGSENLEARLFVVDVGTGASKTILASENVSPRLPYNGLGNVIAVDQRRYASSQWQAGRDGLTDTVYAADQNGALWKFDLVAQGVALNGTPLFVAKDTNGVRQPILGGLAVAAGPGGGSLVYFGTGSFSFTGDPRSVAPQTFYAVMDRGAAVAGRSALKAQTVGLETNGTRATSVTATGAGTSGWYIDLPKGERVVGYPRIENGTVFFPSYQPVGAAAQDCGGGGNNWLYGLNSLTGSAALSRVTVGSPDGAALGTGVGAIALNTGGSAAVRDIGVLTSGGLQTLQGRPQTGAPMPGDADGDGALDDTDGDGIPDIYENQCRMIISVAGADPLYLPRACGRQSWRQLR